MTDIEAAIAWREFLTVSRRQLVDELLSLPQHKSVKDRETAILHSLMLIDRPVSRLPAPIETLASTCIGELMAAQGYVIDGPDLHGPRGWQGSLKDIERKITTLQREIERKIATLQRELEGSLT